MNKYIKIQGARVHNLKNIDIEIPRNKLVVFTGLSGSGKSSLAFDTIYAEGQRRYMESLSSYARQFLGLMDKPDVDYIEGLSPAISIDQKTTSKNPRSTVGTVTEIYDYLRLLYARIGVPHCPKCGKEVKKQTIDQIIDRIMNLDAGTKIQVLAPVVKRKKGEHKKVFENAKKDGYVRVRVDGEIMDVNNEINLPKTYKHDIEIVIDRLKISDSIQKRLTDSVETAIALTGNDVMIDIIDGETLTFSQSYACTDCGISLHELTPQMFSFNNPSGACEECDGLGYFSKVDESLIIYDDNLSIIDGAIYATGWNSANDTNSMAYMYFTALAEHYGFDVNTPYKDLSKEAKNAVLYGTNGEKIKMHYGKAYGGGTVNMAFEGVINNLQRRYEANAMDYAKFDIEKYISVCKCSKCHGARLNPEALAVTINGINIYDFTSLSIKDEMEFMNNLQLTKRELVISAQIVKEIKSRLKFLLDVGLEYLTLSRSSGTLSGGEAQRIRLATQIGSGLTGVLYILDEPSIGLHQRDNDRLIATLKHLRDLDNTVIVVEHDTDTMLAADHIVDIGPGAGVNGGEIVGQGSVADLISSPRSSTGDYLSGRKIIAVPNKRRIPTGKLKIIGAKENNLKNIDVDVPLGVFVCVTGVSGSGKSSLINEILYKKLARELNRAKTHPGSHTAIQGIEQLDKIIDIDQSPIGRTPRSNPATYTGLFNDIREVFASTSDAKVRGYKANRFSFNVKGGRCEACTGDGIVKIEMHFLSDVYVPCEVCGGKRYNRETLEVKYKGKNIYDVLEMTVDEACEFFSNIPKIKKKLETLRDVGMGYIKLGQSSTTLSGGEAQRVKLATELCKRSTGKTIYVLDEPTTGLHTADVHKLIEVIQRLVDSGNSVVIIEHNLDIIKTADYIIDMGPEGGNGGGTVIASGTPEGVSENINSYTGKYLKKILKNS